MFLPTSHTSSQGTLLLHPQSPLMDQHNFHILTHNKYALNASKHDFNACWKFLAKAKEWLAGGSYELGSSSNSHTLCPLVAHPFGNTCPWILTTKTHITMPCMLAGIFWREP